MCDLAARGKGISRERGRARGHVDEMSDATVDRPPTLHSSTLPPGSLVAPMDFGDTGRGLGCVRDVKAGEELLAIPLADCWYGVSSRARPELAPLVASAGETLRDFDAVALHLLLERGSQARDICNRYGETPFDIAESLGNSEVIHALVRWRGRTMLRCMSEDLLTEATSRYRRRFWRGVVEFAAGAKK